MNSIQPIYERNLLHEEPLLLLPTLATALGVNEAIILRQIYYWLTKNEGKRKNYMYGYYWTFNSIADWQKQFPFWEVALKRYEFQARSLYAFVVRAQQSPLLHN